MSTVILVDENTASPRVCAVFDDIKATKKIDAFPISWRCWRPIRSISNCAGPASRPS